MGKSYKKPIIKDKGMKSIYHRLCKRAIKNYIKSHKHELDDLDFEFVIPNFKSIVNDYTYCDYIIDYEHYKFKEKPWYKITGYNKDKWNKQRDLYSRK